MTRRDLGRLVASAAAACVLATTTAGCGRAGDGDEPDRTAALAHQAQQVGIALDIWSFSADRDLATDVTPAVLDNAHVTLDEDVRVTDFTTVRSGDVASSDDLWQFCLVDEDGSWVTYGYRTTLQAQGNDDACAFTGEPDPDPPTFDVRGLAHGFYDTMKADDAEDESSLRVWGRGRTWGSNPKLRALLERRLPAGWTTSRVDQRGWSAVQYCLTAPDGEWYYVRQSTVDEYGDTGRCRLDPDMPSLG